MSRKKPFDKSNPLPTKKLRLLDALDRLACADLREGGQDMPEEASERFDWWMSGHCDSVTEGSGGRAPEDEAQIMRFASLFTLYKTEVRQIVRAFNRNGIIEPDTIRYALAELVTKVLPHVTDFEANFAWVGNQIRQNKPTGAKESAE